MNSKIKKAKEKDQSHCPICLHKKKNLAYVNKCMHTFCYKCISTWCNVKEECPLCKGKAVAIIHDVKSSTNYLVDDLSRTRWEKTQKQKRERRYRAYCRAQRNIHQDTSRPGLQLVRINPHTIDEECEYQLCLPGVVMMMKAADDLDADKLFARMSLRDMFPTLITTSARLAESSSSSSSSSDEDEDELFPAPPFPGTSGSRARGSAE